MRKLNFFPGKLLCGKPYAKILHKAMHIAAIMQKIQNATAGAFSFILFVFYIKL